jgi:phage terminase small subunit
MAKVSNVEMPADWAAEEQEDDYKTPIYDGLKPQWQNFVIAHMKSADHAQAAIDAGYSPKTAKHRGWTLARRPDIVAATNELIDRELRHAENARCAIILRLTADSMCSLEDFTQWSEEEGRVVMRRPEDVDPSYRRCVGMVNVSREGYVVFNTTSQNNARKLLASYHGWDRTAVDAAPPISFDFSGLKG